MKVLRTGFAQQVSPFVILPAPRRFPFRADKRLRQSPVVTVVKMKFPLRDVFRLHLRGHLFRRQPALRKPCLTLRTHRSRAQFPLQPPQHHRQLRRERHTRVLLQHLRQAPVPRLRLFAILCFDSDERREAPRLVYRLDTRGAGLYRRQPVTVPPVPCHLRFTRQRHPPRQVTLPPPYPFSGNDSNLLIVFYVQIMPDDFVMQLHRF